RGVVQALRHHPRQLLQPRIAVELERIEVAVALLEHRQPRLHLAVGLDLDFAQLVAQARDAVVQITQRLLHLPQLRLDARARDGDLPRLGDQVIEGIGVDPQQRRRAGQRRLGPGRRRGRSRRRRAAAQVLQVEAQAVHLRLELAEQLRRKLAALDGRLDLAFDDVRQLAEPDRACHPGAAFERVQAAAQRVEDVLIGGVRLPVAQVAADVRHQGLRFLEEDRQQLLVYVVLHHAQLFAALDFYRRRRLQARGQFVQGPRGFDGRCRCLALRKGGDHCTQPGDRLPHWFHVARGPDVAGEGRPVLERRGEIGYRAEARGARAARKRVRRTRELIGSFGLRFQRLDVLERFLHVDVEEAAREARGADHDLLGLRLHGPQLLRPFHDRLAVESEALPTAQPAYPVPEGRARQGDQLEQLGGGWLLPL